MAGSRIDAEHLTRLSDGERFFLLQRGGAASAIWYLYLKNYVAASGVRPKSVVVMFRDRFFSRPTFRTTHRFRAMLESASHEHEPVVAKLLAGQRTPLERMGDAAERMYPLMHIRDAAQRRLHRLCAAAASPHWNADDIQTKTELAIKAAGPRSDVQAEAATVAREPEPDWDPSPDRSFLPHMIEVAHRARVRLCLYRVRRRPGDPRRSETPELRRYISALAAYARSRGCEYIDETRDARVTLDMFADGDHLAAHAKHRYSAIFLSNLRQHLLR